MGDREMEYRLLQKGKKFYPQRRKKFQLKWRYYSGHPYMDKQFATNIKNAWDIIDNHQKNSEDEWQDIWRPIIIGISTCIIIGIILLFLKKTGMI